MNYTLHYQKLIEKSKLKNRLQRPGTDPDYVYYEKHHIVPKCIGGTNEKSNLVLLTPEEHYVAHQLLVKIYPERPGLIFAAIKMTMSKNGQRMNNKLYGWLRKRVSDHTKMMHAEKKTGMHNKTHSEETKKKMAKNNYYNNGGKQLSGKDNPNFGLKRSDETRQKISIARTGVSNGCRTAETKQKMRDSRKLQIRTSQKAVVVFGVKYSSLIDACRALCKNHKYIIHRLRDDKFLDCYYL